MTGTNWWQLRRPHHALVEELVFDVITEAQPRQLGAISRRIAQAVDPAPIWTPRAAD